MRKQPNSHHCFICGVKNIAGVHVAFYETVSASGQPEVLAQFTGQDIKMCSSIEEAKEWLVKQ